MEKQEDLGWGKSVVEQLSLDLRAEFPGMKGFSANNLWLMRQFYSEYSSPAFLEQLVQEILSPVLWGHLVEIAKKVDAYGRISGKGKALNIPVAQLEHLAEQAKEATP